MKPAIEVKGLSKSYIINHKNKASYSTLKDDLANVFKRPLGLANQVDGQNEEFWALNDISFDVPRGEIFGVIGRNGSGKSTLLKILSRIVEPTKGSVILRGRAASLLEVGTGFHPELTGRENVYFNGSMLGMSRKEIGRKFDEIVAFSEVEKFLDTPVKFYSSGMYVRLAFSVAAHLEPDILILDEVLAVGDAGFQKKSLSKITQTMEEGRTVLFVSHSMESVKQLCSNGILLNDGKIDFAGSTEALTDRYMQLMRSENPDAVVNAVWKADKPIKNDYFEPLKIYIEDDKSKTVHKETRNNQDYWFCVEGNLKTDSSLFNIGYSIKNQVTKSQMYMTLSTDGEKSSWPKLKEGRVVFRGKIPKHLLNAGTYKLSLISSIHNKHWIFSPDESTPSVELAISSKLDISEQWIGARSGLFAPIIEWDIKH